MRKFRKRLLIASLLFATFSVNKIIAATQEILTVVCVIGTDMLVQLDQNLILAEVDTSVIGTSGTDTYLLSSIQVGLFNNHSTGTDSLVIDSPDADGTSFRTVKNDGSGKYVYLQLTTDTDANGNKVATPLVVDAGSTIRKYAGTSGNIIENEIHDHTYYAEDNAKNSTESGTYETTIIYAWQSA